MGKPVSNLSKELVAAHPALQEFVSYVEQQDGVSPDPEKILVLNARPNDGIINLVYLEPSCTVGGKCRSFSAQVDASDRWGKVKGKEELKQINPQDDSQFIDMRQGWGIYGGNDRLHPPRNAQGEPLKIKNGQASLVYEGDQIKRLVGGDACKVVKNLGGNYEEKTTCTEADIFMPTEFKDYAGFYGTWIGLNWLGLDLGALHLMRRGLQLPKVYQLASRIPYVKLLADSGPLGKFPFSRWVFSQFKPVPAMVPFPPRTFVIGTPLAWKVSGMGLGLGMGGAAMMSMSLILPSLGMDQAGNRHEIFGLAAATGYFMDLNLLHFFADYFTDGKLIGETRILSSLGASLLTAQIVDNTIGRAYEPGSWQREGLRAAGFFAPQIFHSIMGSRVLPFTTRPWVAATGRWLTRAMVASFAADLGYAFYRDGSEGFKESARIQKINDRAQELRTQEDGDKLWPSFWRGAFSVFMPTVAAETTVSDNYKQRAENEFKARAKEVSDNATSYFRHNLIHGDSGENRELNFYTEINGKGLRDKNELANITVDENDPAKKRLLPVKKAARQFEDPEIFAKNIENPEANPVAYIHDRFKSHDLSPLDAQEVWNRLTLHQLRAQIAEEQVWAQGDDSLLVSLFDAEGNLNPGKETELVTKVFSDLEDPKAQVLALRQVALVARIRVLREAVKAAGNDLPTSGNQKAVRLAQRDLSHYSGIARELGLMNASGEFVDNEITQHGERIAIAKAPPPVKTHYSEEELILKNFVETQPG